MARPWLGPASVKLIELAVERLFKQIRDRTFGDRHPTGKHLYIRYSPELTLKGIFDAAASSEGIKPAEDVFKTLLKITGTYIDAAEAKAKAKTVQAVQSFLQEAASKKVKTNVETVLSGKLYEVMGEVHRDIKKIIETESTIHRNTSILDGITKVNAAAGIEDPTVFFVVVRDGVRCSECTRLHLLEDGITPRVWKLSSVGHSYHRKGDSNPKVGGLHPHCRCTLTTLLPGYGFNKSGTVTYISPGHDEYARQHS